MPETRIVHMDPRDAQILSSLDFVEHEAKTLVIENDPQYKTACEHITEIARRTNDLETLRRKLKAPVLEAGRNIDKTFKVPIECAKSARKIIESKISGYRDRCAIEDERLAEAVARRADEERVAAEKIALQEMDAGNFDKAEAILNNIEVNQAPIAISAPPKAPGVSVRETWKCREINLLALIIAISKDQAPLRLVQLNNSAANQFAKSVRDTLPTPGLEFYKEELFAVSKL
jgi:hypothetical protein